MVANGSPGPVDRGFVFPGANKSEMRCFLASAQDDNSFRLKLGAFSSWYGSVYPEGGISVTSV